MSLNCHNIKINLIHSVHLPGVTVGVSVIIERIKEDEEVVGSCVKVYDVLNPVYI